MSSYLVLVFLEIVLTFFFLNYRIKLHLMSQADKFTEDEVWVSIWLL